MIGRIMDPLGDAVKLYFLLKAPKKAEIVNKCFEGQILAGLR